LVEEQAPVDIARLVGLLKPVCEELNRRLDDASLLQDCDWLLATMATVVGRIRASEARREETGEEGERESDKLEKVLLQQVTASAGAGNGDGEDEAGKEKARRCFLNTLVACTAVVVGEEVCVLKREL
jgi:hypothetical protein